MGGVQVGVNRSRNFFILEIGFQDFGS